MAMTRKKAAAWIAERAVDDFKGLLRRMASVEKEVVGFKERAVGVTVDAANLRAVAQNSDSVVRWLESFVRDLRDSVTEMTVKAAQLDVLREMEGMEA